MGRHSPKLHIWHHFSSQRCGFSSPRAYLNALPSVLDWNMKRGSVYLWSLAMFHCHGWCYTWAMAAQAGSNVYLKCMTPKGVFDAIHEHKVAHLGGAPTVLTMLANAGDHERKPLTHKVEIMIGAGPPAAAILAKVESQGFEVFHGYGMTETYGPSVMNIWKEEWDALPLVGCPSLRPWLGHGMGSLAHPVVDMMDPETMTPVPRDGKTMEK